MSTDKKDLTRIEDLGEFIHELNAEDDFNSEEGLPDLPSSDDDEAPAFGEESSGLDFGTTEESSFEATSDDFSSSDFGSTEEFGSSTFASSSDESSTTDFGSDDFSSSTFGEDEKSDEDPFTLSESSSEETPADDISSWNTDVPLTNTETLPETTSFSTPEPEPEPEPIRMPEPEPAYTPSQEFKTPETFEDLKKFSESSSFTGMATEGNPSFSVLLKNVRFIEDVNDIMILLRELNLLTDSEEQVKGRLMRGMLLVPRISEYAAIFLAHKLRRFDVDIQVGLSDEIHPPKHQEKPETGIVSKFNLYQNQTHHFQFDDPKLELSQIIVAATPSLEGYQVLRYMGVASEHKMLDSHVVEDAESSEVPRHYQELAQKLKAHALKAHANAVVGLNYQLTPIPSEFGIGGHKYRLTCTGNLVWVNKL